MRVARCSLASDCIYLLWRRRICCTGALTEECRSDSNKGGTFEDSRFEVTAHSHGQRIESRSRSIELLEFPAHGRKPHTLARRIIVIRWYAHQPAEREAR